MKSPYLDLVDAGCVPILTPEILPSGKRLQFPIEHGHRNSGFTWIYPLNISIVFCMFTRG